MECISHPGSTFYNIPALFKLSEKIDTERLKAAIEKTIAAHPYLNMTIFTDAQGNFRARRDDDAVPQVEFAEVDKLPEKLIAPFELLGGKLSRFRIYRTAEGCYLFMELHHIIGDGSSVSILLNDINEAYMGRPVAKENYTGFELGLDEEKLRKTKKYDDAKAYFDGLLAEADREMLPEGDVYGGPASSGTLVEPANIDLAEVKRFLRSSGQSANAFFNAAFAFVLSKFTGKKEALYTTIYNGRSDSRVSRSVTMMVKTFPVFLHLKSGDSVLEFVDSVNTQLMNGMANDIYSFAEIAQTHGISSDVMFVYQGNEFIFDSIGGEKAEMAFIEGSEAKAPLHVEIFEKDGRPVFNCEYSKARFSDDYMHRLLACLEEAVREFMRKKRLSDICIADEKALAEMDSFNETNAPYPNTDIVSLFRAAADRFPERPAVIFKEEELSYRQVDEISDRIAAHLHSRGIGKGTVVSILIPRCSYMATASLGVLKTGAAYQPLDPSYPSERLSFMMKDADCRLLIADESLLEKVPDYTGEVLLTKDIPSLPAAGRMTGKIDSGDLFILLYTSGSTGVPKGVMLEHGNLANFCGWYREYYRLDENCRVAAYASYGFDANMMDMYPALTTGACVCIVEEEIRLDLLAMEIWYKRRGITHSFMTTQICRQFYTLTSPEKLCYLSGGGEKLVPVAPKTEGPKLINCYGPTECSIFSTTMPVEKLYERVPIGRPVSNYKCYVVDENLHRLPPLVPGELLVAGRGVGRGYLNRPDLTEKAFIRNPFSDDPMYARTYRTGDIVRLLPDGTIDFLGRNDGQVKVRGFRIELSEVEGIVREFPGISDATVQAFENEKNGENFIAAYVVSKDKVDESALKEFIKASKPAYMVPAVTMQIDAIPLNQNQKVNKRALPKPVLAQDEGEYVAPKTELQKKLCDMFASALGIDKVGINENFFELGGTSLTVAKIAVKAAAEKLPIAFKDIFDYPTVEAMEKYVLSITQSSSSSSHDFDATEHPALDRNQPKLLSELQTAELGGVLLTGATGFLGIHVLKALLDDTDSKIYCLMRGDKQGIETRLRGLLMYYFSNPYRELFGDRIIPVDGDITDRDSIMALSDLPFRTVINCAACVKHFAADDLLDRVNWHGVENLIDLCVNANRRLTQVSTLSVAGTSVNQQISPEKRMCENELYFGQTLDNKYAYSKFKAEEAVLNAIEHRGLNGRIVRVGNLMPRYSDGEFQINSVTNAFMRSLRAFAAMKEVPVSMMDQLLEFSPIDCTAKSVVALSAVENFTVFHASNSHRVQMGDVVESMNRCGIFVETAEEKDFQADFQSALADEEMSMIVSPLITYQTSDVNMEEFNIGYDNAFTTKALYRLHVKWPIISEAYLDQVFTSLRTIGFFDLMTDQ